MRVTAPFLVLILASFAPTIADAQEPEDVFLRTQISTEQPAPLEITLEITSPTLNGLYVENRPVTIKTSIKNIGETTLDIDARGLITKLGDPNFTAETFGFEQRGTAPGGGASSETSRILEAGNYRVLVLAATQDERFQGEELLFVVSSHQDLLVRQQAEIARAQAESAADSADSARLSLYVSLAAITVGGAAIYFAKRSADKHHTLTKESNDLLRTELRERLRPILQIIDSSTEMISSKEIVRVRCTLQNLGPVPARAVRYWFKATENSTIIGVVQEWNELKSGEGHALGSILQNSSQVMIFDIPWRTGLARQNVALLLECVYLEDSHEEIVVIMDVTGGLQQIPQVWYTQKDIDDARKRRSNP